MPVRQEPPAGPPPVQRLRIAFGVDDGARYVSHLDLTQAWVRALRRMGLPLAYSYGFNPHPRISVAVPLPVGFSACAELLDIFMDKPVDPVVLLSRLAAELPCGLTVQSIVEVPMGDPPLPSQITAADYVITFLEPPPADLAERVQRLLAAESLPFTRTRQGKEAHFDLRPRILAARLETCDGEPALFLRLVHSSSGAARAQDVMEALGLPPLSAGYCRTRLVLAGDRDAPPPA